MSRARRESQPMLGDVVTTTVGLDEREFTGTVVWCGAAQYAVEGAEGEHHLVLYSRPWTLAEAGPRRLYARDS